ncbi:hypothetical protein GF325_16005 [Candidatus Bathyarchaeota archaeon]|nr:hypothetical protein [Candidatus Bathyarchaeota archaeon]
MKKNVPHPEFHSWMHERCEIPTHTVAEKLSWWRRQPASVQAIEAVLSRLFTGFHMLKGIRPWVVYKFIIRAYRLYFKVFNRLRSFGKHNIPEQGCIFYVNHPGSYDPLIMFATLPNMQISAFVAWGNSWFADMIDQVFNMSAFRHGNVHQVVEDVVRRILTKNRYFAIWPEGHPHPGPIEQGFSSIIRVYATLNHDRDRIPFVPVLIRGKGAFRYGVSHKMGPMEVHYFKPIFINREWLRKPSEGGKTPRQIIDHLMEFLARKNGQGKLAPNPRLESKRRYHKIKHIVSRSIESITHGSSDDAIACETCQALPRRLLHGKIAKVKQVPTTLGDMSDVVIDPTGVHRIVQCQQCQCLYSITCREGKHAVELLATVDQVKRILFHVVHRHDGKLLSS